MWEPIYKQDKSMFLLADFSCLLQPPIDPFVLPSHVLQIFYADAYIRGPWHIVLNRERQSRRTQGSKCMEFINTRVCVLTLQLETLLHLTTTKHGWRYHIGQKRDKTLSGNIA